MVAVQERSRTSSRQSSAVNYAPAPRAVRRSAPPVTRIGTRPAVGPAGRPGARPVISSRSVSSRSVSPSTYRRRQALAAGAVAALAAVASVMLGSLGGGALTAPERPLPVIAGQLYEVQPGDTFWAIARTLDPDGDPRPLVDRLVADHGTAVLVVGEHIRLPIS